MIQKLEARQRLCKGVNKLIRGMDIRDSEQFLGHLVSNKVEVHGNVFHP